MDAVWYGIIEGLTEFLPVSSTGHLILLSHVLGGGQTEFLKTFEIVIQLGAILSVVMLYWKRVLVSKDIMLRVVIGFIPTAVLGFLLYPFVKAFLLESMTLVLWALLLGGAAIILFEYFFKEREDAVASLETIPYKTAAMIGVFQVLAMVPGVSRSAATILGGLSANLNRKTIVEFSFLLAIPTMLAASGWDLLQSAGGIGSGEWGFLAVGFVVSFLVSLAAVRFFLKFVQKHTFVPFGVYRILLAVLFLVFFL